MAEMDDKGAPQPQAGTQGQAQGQTGQDGQGSQGTATQPQGQAQGGQENTVPEKYEYEVPDTWDEAYKAKVESIARENKLSNEQMKKFAEIAQNEHQAFIEARKKSMEAWEHELKQDKDFSSKNFNTAVQYARMGLENIDTNGELKKVLEESGYGSHPAVVRAMYKIGKMLDNDKIVGKGGGNTNEVPLWDRLYNTKQ